MKFTFDQLCKLEQTMSRASSGLRAVGVDKETAGNLRSLEYILSVVRQSGQTLADPAATEEDKASAMACFYDGLFR